MKKGRSRRQEKKSWFYSRWFLITLAVFFCLIVASLVKEAVRSHRIKQEIAALEEQIAQLEQVNAEQTRQVEFLKTDLYFEEQARLKLGLKEPGEKVIVLKEAPVGQEKERGESLVFANSHQAEQQKAHNAILWWRYFFGG